MTVAELREELAKYPDDLEVLKRYDDPEQGAYALKDISAVYRDGNDILILD